MKGVVEDMWEILELCDWKSEELAATIADEEVDAAEGKPVGNLVLEAIAIVSDVRCSQE